MNINRIKKMDDIIHVFYINLEHRTDRKRHVEDQLLKIGLDGVAVRFPAILNEYGAIGCTMSHLECLTMAAKNNWSHVMILEDDILFTDPELFKLQLNRFLKTGLPWDTVMLGGNIINPYVKMNQSCIKIVGGCQTTTAYIVNGPYIKKLIDNITIGLESLNQHPSNKTSFAIDRHWIQLQQVDQWFVIIPLTVTQLDGYSDIEQKNISYTDKMLKSI